MPRAPFKAEEACLKDRPFMRTVRESTEKGIVQYVFSKAEKGPSFLSCVGQRIEISFLS